MIDIIYSSNQRGFKGIILSVLSILEKTKSPITVHVLSMDATEINPSYQIVSQHNIDELDKIIKKYNADNKVVLYDLRKINDDNLGSVVDSVYTPYTYLRLFSNKVMTQDKAIYLDIDTMVQGDIKELYDIDIQNYEIGTVNDAAGVFWIRKDYFNAGVILINFKKCHETKVFERCIEKIKEKKYYFVDQTPLNNLITSRLILNRKFNEQRNLSSDTVIKHFCKRMKYLPFPRVWNIKQWDIENVHQKLKIHEFDDIYKLYNSVKKNFEE